MTNDRMTDAELAEEARQWSEGELTPADLVDAPEAAPRAKESELLNLRLPRMMVTLLTEFARREGISCQVLIKRWLDERIRQEHQKREMEKQPGRTST
jgi:hypothetical protein